MGWATSDTLNNWPLSHHPPHTNVSSWNSARVNEKWEPRLSLFPVSISKTKQIPLALSFPLSFSQPILGFIPFFPSWHESAVCPGPPAFRPGLYAGPQVPQKLGFGTDATLKKVKASIPCFAHFSPSFSMRCCHTPNSVTDLRKRGEEAGHHATSWL